MVDTKANPRSCQIVRTNILPRQLVDSTCLYNGTGRDIASQIHLCGPQFVGDQRGLVEQSAVLSHLRCPWTSVHRRSTAGAAKMRDVCPTGGMVVGTAGVAEGYRGSDGREECQQQQQLEE